jgi:rare lipoprotein A
MPSFNATRLIAQRVRQPCKLAGLRALMGWNDAWMRGQRLGFFFLAMLIAIAVSGCASSGGSAGGAPSSRPDRDGPEARPPPDLDAVPDAVPRVEPIRSGGPNKPYEVLGRSYTPITVDAALVERGLASWYGRKFHGRSTANGEVYNMYAMTAAHPTMPLPSYARVRNPKNGREVVVRINDRGPFHEGRVIDLSYTAALKLDLLRGVAPVEVERITFEAIRAGTWRRDGSVASVMPVNPAPKLPTGPQPTTPTPTPSAPPSPPGAGPSVGVPQVVPIAGGAVASAPLGAASVSAAAASSLGEREPKSAAGDAKGFWIQLGAFRQRAGADAFHRQVIADVEWLAPLLAVMDDKSLYRLQAGPFVSRSQAQSAAQRVRDALRLVPQVVERR